MKISPPSSSLSKSTLLITPLFLCILAFLSTVSEVSYLFILQFSQNVASDVDLNLIGSMRRSNDTEAFDNERLISQLRAGPNRQAGQAGGLMDSNIPIVRMEEVQKWVSNHSIVRGVSPRWILPITLGSMHLDSMMIIMDIQNEKKVGLAQRANIDNLTVGEVAVSYEVFGGLQLAIGDELSMSFQLKNLMSSNKLLEKFTDQESSSQDVPPAPALTTDIIGPLINDTIKKYDIDYNLTDDDVKKITELANTPLNYTLEVRQKIRPEGAWASVLHNVIVVDQRTAEAMVDKLTKQLLDKFIDSLDSIPPWLLPYKYLGVQPKLSPYITTGMQKYAPIVAVSFKQRSAYYRPHQKTLNAEVVTLLQQIPPNIQVLPLKPLYDMSLAIKYFFDSILQIFSFIAVLLYVNVMRIILKQVYDEKEVEIGVWRTLGIGGVKTEELTKTTEASGLPLQHQNNPIQQKLSTSLSIKQDLLYKWQMLNNVGHFPYWFTVTLLSTVLFVLFKWILMGIVASKLHYQPVGQSILQPFLVFLSVLIFSQYTCISHILSIYGNSIVESMKPFKRTFDIVRVKVVKMATFGIDPELLMVSCMLIYYGMVSYYFIPRAVLYNNAQLQTLLFNSIFFFMILGAIVLCTIMQSYLEIAILNLMGMASKQLSSMRSVMLKNLKAKRFTNLKISLSLALIFAFVLFFTSGINMEIKLIKSFINRGLGSDLVLENYDEGFNVTKIDSYLGEHSGTVTHAWLSGGLARKDLRFKFIDNRRSDKSIGCTFVVFSPGFMNASYYEYYVPDYYLPGWEYSRLPNGVDNGFDTIYNGTESVGGFNPNDTYVQLDPKNVSSLGELSSPRYAGVVDHEQVINIAISTSTARKLGASPGYIYKLNVRNTTNGRQFDIRAKITHVLKALQGFDMLFDRAFLSEQQAKYLYSAIESTIDIKYEKLLVKGLDNQLQVKDVSSKLLALSPEHTELNEVSFVESSFKILETYLQWFITLLSAVMNTLSVLLLFLYTRNKCKEELEMYRILRAVGTPVRRLRVMIFCQVFVRVLISVLVGIIMGVLFSMAFANQVQALLMVKMPSIHIGLIGIMAVILLGIFSATLIYSTKDLQKMTVAQMARG